ncbi:MAG: rhomboid family intramembrane serine protease [Alphaproteobacteria bacterium]|nr:rhomboid family intramembrane serine protease [Alphaproteobacteria bacterium]
MFLPYGDHPNPAGFRAWVTWTLIVVNVLLWLTITLPLQLTPPDTADPAWAELVARVTANAPPDLDHELLLRSLTAWDLFVEKHAFVPARARLDDLLVAMFLHANLAHVVGNMLFLRIYGDNIEHRFGRVGFALLYLLSGVVASAAFALVAWNPTTPLVGASGAISGVLGAYFVLFPRNRVKVLVFLFPFVLDTWLVPAGVVLGLYVIVDNLLPLLAGVQGGVGYGAHLGGFVTGALFGVVARLAARDRS